MLCLSLLSIGESGKCCKSKQPHVDVFSRLSTFVVREQMSNGNLSQTPKKVCRPSANVNSSCCRLCKSIGDVSFSKNIFAKGNRALLAAAEDICGGPLRRDQLLPHLLCRPCERRLKNFVNFKTTIKESQSSFERVKRCVEISPSVYRTLAKSAKESGSRSRRGLSFGISRAGELQPSTGKEVREFFFNPRFFGVDVFLSFFMALNGIACFAALPSRVVKR